MKFSFIIPTVKQTTMVRDCITSIRQHELQRGDYEIIVVEDGSDPEIQEWLRNYCDREGVRLFLKRENKGFAHTVNVGLAHATGEVMILLNNDVVLIKPILKQLERAFARDSQIGIVGAKLLYPNMQVQHAGVVRMPRSMSFIHVNKHVQRDDPRVCQSKYFLSVTGALYAIRRAAYSSIGNFNENYFLACEDTEYSLRAWQKGWRVFYAADVEASHQEGGTRGNTDNTKLRKGPQWFLRERETFAKFVADFPKYDVERFETWVHQINTGKTELDRALPNAPKLEIGSGYAPQPGYLHLDVRADLPQLDYVCDFANERLPFADDQLSEVISNHCIEHISYRKLPFVLSEWLRVLQPGGRVFFRTPDLEFIARTYLEGKTTPEWPDDEKFVATHLADSVTPGWWANIKLFAGQDYPSNFHCLCFDFDMVKTLLEKIGFEDVRRLNVKPVFSPGELQIEAFKKAVKDPAKRILVKRAGALGDVLLTTPIVRCLRQIHGPEAVIDVATLSPAAYANNPNVTTVVRTDAPATGYDEVIDLDLAYERTPEQHIIESYAAVAFGKDGLAFDKATELFPTREDEEAIDRRLIEAKVDAGRAVVLHMAVTWKNRTWPLAHWRVVVDLLLKAGLEVVQVGSGNDYVFPVQPGLHDFTKKLSVHQIAALVRRARCFVGNDSGLLHVAGTTDTPIVGLFTSAKGEYRVPYRNGKYGDRVTIVKPDISCYGCLHRELPPVVFADCRRGDYACLGLIKPVDVTAAVVAMLEGGG